MYEKNTHNTRASGFFTFTTTRPVAILMVVIGISVFGFISYKQLSVNLMPDISYPSLTVRTEIPGTAPEEVETSVSRPMEQALGLVTNLVNISSISKAGQSDVKLEFTWDTDMTAATADVREKLDQVFLPEEAKRPIILRYDPSLDPILRLGVFGDTLLTRMRYRAEEAIERQLETIEGVAAVKVKGGLEEEIRVELNEQKLTLIGIDIQQVRQRLQQENVNLAGGNLREGQAEYLVRTLNEFRSVDEIGNVVIGTWNGREIRVRDVGRVTRTTRDREIITRINGQESVEVEIYKEADANIVAVAERVKRRVFGTPEQQAYVRRMQEKSAETNGTSEDRAGKMRQRAMTAFIAASLPDNMQIEVLSDQSVFIQNSVDEVKKTALYGGLFAVLVLFVFLRKVSSTLIVGIAIPVSVVATFAPMKIYDVSLNIMSLGGLALGIGMLVDNSIVVLESIARCREEGDDFISATIRGVGEVGSAVFASTLTTVAVFFPIVFVEGIAGQIFSDLALTVVFSLFASLAVALFLIPMLASRSFGQSGPGTLDSLLQHSVLRFSSMDKVVALRDDDHAGRTGLWHKFTTAVTAILFTLVLVPWRLVKLSGAFLLSLLKGIALFPLALVLPVIALLERIGLLKKGFGQQLVLWSGDQQWQKLFDDIWPTYLRFQSVQALVASYRVWLENFRGATVANKLIRLVLFCVVFLPYSGLRFVLHLFIELLFRVVHFVFFTLAIMIKALLFITGMVFSVPALLLSSVFLLGYGAVERRYPALLQAALRNRGTVLGATAVLFAVTMWGLAPKLGSELIPEVHQGEFHVKVTLPVGTPVEQTDARIRPVQEMLLKDKSVAKVASVAGTDVTSNASSEEGEHTAKITVTVDRSAGNLIENEEALTRRLRQQMAQFSGISWQIARPVLFSFKTPVEVQIHGYNLRTLQQVAARVEQALHDVPGLDDISTNMQAGNPEVRIIYDRDLLAQYNLNILDVASIVRNKIRGDVATEFKDEDRRIDVLVQLQEEDRRSIDDLRRLIVNPGAARAIPLDAVADVRISEGPAEIRRVDQQRTAVISANITGRDLSSVSADIQDVLNRIGMPPEFTYTLGGQNKEMQTSINSLMFALALAIFLVYIVMASQFESLVHPFVIIFTIPLALIGVIIFLYLFSIPLSIVVFLGMIMLAGIVVNNAIVLVDYINHLRARGLEKTRAIIEAGRVRLRPIMMTTLTTVLGLLPMAVSMGDGAEVRAPMAITVIIGLLSSTALTLLVIPLVYSLVDRSE